ncbi:MAG: hypothetical protein QMD12_00385 [Candidatus Aenigmarchaeota archaeon]|nr:hypothetical protein [Candidatus Aenigmarchaeota archaeon]
MVLSKKKGYRTERKIKLMFERDGWRVVRAGASLGEADLVCIKNKKCILLQVKSSREKTFYYYGYMKKKLEGFPFYLVVDFGYGRIRILYPKQKIKVNDGSALKEFLLKN